jgi:geranylgeranyl pyrophosphate synthase
VPATGRTFKVGKDITVKLNNAEFERIRKAAKLESILRVRGETWCARLNTELHAAQAKRKQPVEDGYTFYIHGGGSRLRLYIVAFTARAQAHERAHSSILKLMETTKYDVKTRATLIKQATRKAGAKKAAITRRRRRAEAELERNASGSS